MPPSAMHQGLIMLLGHPQCPSLGYTPSAYHVSWVSPVHQPFGQVPASHELPNGLQGLAQALRCTACAAHQQPQAPHQNAPINTYPALLLASSGFINGGGQSGEGCLVVASCLFSEGGNHQERASRRNCSSVSGTVRCFPPHPCASSLCSKAGLPLSPLLGVTTQGSTFGDIHAGMM